MRLAILLFALVLILTACNGGVLVQPGPAPAPAGFEARGRAEGIAEYVVMAGPDLPLTPTYKVHGVATAVASVALPYLRIYLEGDAWVEPTVSGNAAVQEGRVAFYRPTGRTSPADSPLGRKVYYAPLSPPPASSVPSPGAVSCKQESSPKEPVTLAYLVRCSGGT